MAETKIFAGPRVRRIRTGLGKTQTAMAGELGISPSYLNLIERNQRPLTAQLVLKLVSTYRIDVEDLQPSNDVGSVSALKEVFSDPLLEGELPGDTELLELSDGAPNASAGVVKLYRAYREQLERLTELSRLMQQSGATIEPQARRLPFDEVRGVFENVPWCFPALERAAGRISDALREHTGRMAALYSLLRADHGIAVQVLPVDTMPVWRKRYDRHSQRLFLSERLQRPERAELLAQELVLLRESSVLDEEIELLNISGDEARRLARQELARYTALAVLMPYDKFYKTAQKVHHDMSVLEARFETSFAQVAQRLVSLQDRSGGHQAGLPFFMMEIDQAGAPIRRLGAKGFPQSRFGGHCPKLSVHHAFAAPGELLCERVMLPSGDVFLTIARTIDGPMAAPPERRRRTAVLLGIADDYATTLLGGGQKPQGKEPIVFSADSLLARNIAAARALPDPRDVPPLSAGPSCRLCEREDCVARSSPPITRPLGLDELVSGFGAYGLT